MFRQRFQYLVLIIFLASIILIVFLQYNSGKSIRNLISDNESLLNELQIKTRLQKLQTDVIFSESALRDLIANNDAEHIQGITRDNDAIGDELTEIDNTIRPTSDPALLDQLKLLISEKFDNSERVIHTLYANGKDSALNFIRTLRGRVIRDSIIQTVALINDSRQKALSHLSASVSTNSGKAKTWGIILAIIACLATVITFWYLIDQGQRQQKLIQTLDTSEKRLKEASRIQEQFVANMSHEIRTPMNAVIGFAGLLQRTSLNVNQQDYVKSIRSSAENLLTIINDILDLSRIESGMMHIEKLPFNLRELLDSIVTMMNVKAQSLNLFIKTEVEETLPKILKGDSIRLTQILINLISNGLKFTHEGGVTIRVDTKNRKRENVWVRFEISDTGIGIESKQQRTIFERFHQAQPETTRRYGGTGLGLSIVKQLVEIQNGIISVSSEQGKGSVFTVELPYQVTSDSEIELTLPAPELSTEPVLEGVRILVAEDNPMNQKLIKYLLEQWQINFHIVTNGVEALNALRQNAKEYGMLLMDIQMPEMDGYATTEKIRNDLKLAIPIIAMTAHALTGEREKCLRMGMDDYISKPINEDQLKKIIIKYARKNLNAEGSVIDLDYLRNLSKGDKAFEKNMIMSFSEQIPAELSELKLAIEQQDYNKISNVAHNMKSTLSYLGLQKLAVLLQQIEKESENKTGLSYITNNFVLIDNTCQLALKEARELIS